MNRLQVLNRVKEIVKEEIINFSKDKIGRAHV